MNKTIQDALELVDVNMSISSFLINLLIAAILSIILKYVYDGELTIYIQNRELHY